jgi:trehalose 6-phosphate synthase/phosphatase
LPKLLRERLPEASIGFFLHIPFPSFELFRLLPWRNELLEGILGADLVGFHTYDYVRHFLSCTSRLLALEHHIGNLSVRNRMVKVDAFPMGIDYQKYSQADKLKQVKKEIEQIRRMVGERKIIVSIDRLDYTKGIIQRLEAFDLFLSKNPRYKEKVTMILVAVPSRSNVSEYRQLRQQLEQLVGRVNGEHATIGWIPVWYLYKSLSFERITALYNVAEVALLTPVRDGMNLIAKEYVAAKGNGHGVLILSEMAGASSELGEALIVNANNKHEIVMAIKRALDMPAIEQTLRLKPMQQRLKRYDVARWANDFVDALKGVKKSQQKLSLKALTDQTQSQIIRDYNSAEKRLLLLDYDGTLVKFHSKPQDAGPDTEVIELLKKLEGIPNSELVIISGRDKQTISNWLGFLDIILIAEHGAWIKWKGHDWQSPVDAVHSDWKKTLRPILDLFADRTPGASVEEKDFSLVWHCRRSDPALAAVRAQELRDALADLTANMQVGVFEGSKIIEVKQHGVSKGRATELVLHHFEPDFVLAAGDDYTDEEMFSALPKDAYSIKVGAGPSEARFYVDSVDKIRTLLTLLSGEQSCSD